MDKFLADWRKILATIVAVIVAVGVTITIVDNGPDHPPDTPRATVEIHLGGQGSKTITLTPKAQEVAAAQDSKSDAGSPQVEDDLHEDAKPTSGELAAGNQAAPASGPTIPDQVPQAAQSVNGCRSQFVRNQSSRNGAKVALGVIHWTGSSILTGWADVNAITKWFDTPAAQASSNFIVDDEGNCAYTVPMTAKSWTQAAANPWSVSIEYINPGVLPVFRGAAGRARTVALMRLWHRDFGIPYRRGAVNSSCVPTRSGFLAHRDLGPCGGGHPDIGIPSAVDGLINDADRPVAQPITAAEQRACSAVHAYRLRRNAGKPKTAAGTAAFERRRSLVRARGHKCVDGRAAHG